METLLDILGAVETATQIIKIMQQEEKKSKMNVKEWQLLQLRPTRSAYHNYAADIINFYTGEEKTLYFLWYSKKDIIYQLRNKYDCICPKNTY